MLMYFNFYQNKKKKKNCRNLNMKRWILIKLALDTKVYNIILYLDQGRREGAGGTYPPPLISGNDNVLN